MNGRNQPCPCGSGKKYKHCCGRGQRQTALARLDATNARLITFDGMTLAEAGLETDNAPNAALV